MEDILIYKKVLIFLAWLIQ